jgi:protein-S-isoprenylcysteine O-methyltransferase Ste14
MTLSDDAFALTGGETIPTEVRRSCREWWVRSRAWLSILLLAPFGAAALVSRPLVWQGTLSCLALDAIGWTVFCAGVLFRWWATLHIGGRKAMQLAVVGPYSMCRNPLYFGTFLITLSIAFYFHSLTFAAGLVFAAWLYLGVTVPEEERYLRQKFADEYVRYCQDVPRFFPRFRQWHSPPQIDVLVSGLRAEGYRAVRYVWVPLIAETLAHLRMEAWWPHWWTLP